MVQGHIYWANSLFTEADRRYNEHCAATLRAAGYTVFLAQEAPINSENAPSAEGVFRTDTSAVARSDVLVACLDQETIDSGVACEIGIAFELGIPIIGLYTDVRQYREGPGRMYKNLYVLGAIEANGLVVGSIVDLVRVLPRFLSESKTGDNDFDAQAPTYPDFVRQLESWYIPTWDARASIDRWIRATAARRVLDIGCGPGRTGQHIREQHPSVSYLGFDSSPRMIVAAKTLGESPECRYTAGQEEVQAAAAAQPFDLVIALFVLHDQTDKAPMLRFARRCLRPGGSFAAIDLTVSDLPRLVLDLRLGLARPFRASDSRLDPGIFVALAEGEGFSLQESHLIMPAIRFPTKDSLRSYLETFGVYRGQDLPLGFDHDHQHEWRTLIDRQLRLWRFPYSDRRVFLECLFA